MLNAIILHDAYFFLIPLAILEGPILALLCGVGGALGYINPFIAWGILVVCDLIPDLMYYGLGRWGATMPRVRRFATRTRLIREHLPHLEVLWREHPALTLGSAKLSYGVSPPLIVSAGISGISFWRFTGLSVLVAMIYLGALDALGYVIGSTFGVVSGFIGGAPLYIALVGVFFLCMFGVIVFFARKRLPLRQAQEESNIIET